MKYVGSPKICRPDLRLRREDGGGAGEEAVGDEEVARGDEVVEGLEEVAAEVERDAGHVGEGAELVGRALGVDADPRSRVALRDRPREAGVARVGDDARAGAGAVVAAADVDAVRAVVLRDRGLAGDSVVHAP